ncbi:hypothetical protein DM02DRAFT_547155 [Periconia macrospinosa]|uniref:PD-(D/E)XK nuclease-like domain-containing protein n=1 Tax=Periconia macrospinosa TaxID=97972 RepID=A0A2V1CZW6_9PLEO|nr:hypothetical protein DM02DRAFT_547155 [Periconia macrospinosa]
MTDAYTQTVPLQCGFEVKERGGDSNEADMQLGIWSAAGLQLLKQQRSAVTGSGEILPFVGGTIVGHEWRVHIAWKDEKGERICDWLKETYWPWLRDSVLIPLS